MFADNLIILLLLLLLLLLLFYYYCYYYYDCLIFQVSFFRKWKAPFLKAFLTVTLMFVAHISIALVVLITLGTFLNFWEIKIKQDGGSKLAAIYYQSCRNFFLI